MLTLFVLFGTRTGSHGVSRKGKANSAKGRPKRRKSPQVTEMGEQKRSPDADNPDLKRKATKSPTSGKKKKAKKAAADVQENSRSDIKEKGVVDL